MDSAAWEWMGRVWQNRELQDYFLDCQRRHDLDIVLALGLVYLGGAGFAVDASWLAATQARIEPWQRQVILPLRAARDGWQGANRKAAQALLLSAERHLIGLVLQVLPTPSDRPRDELILSNLAFLVSPPPSVRQALVAGGL